MTNAPEEVIFLPVIIAANSMKDLKVKIASKYAKDKMRNMFKVLASA